ncbi:MAG: hypothetical protein WAV93_12275 [Bacteroidales bacterium]
MKKKFLLTAIAVVALATMAFAADRDPAGAGPGSASPGQGSIGSVGSLQQVIVNNYYQRSGYEYASRIKRFHTSYVTFDFYSPVYTEVFWYRYSPYTWGVSIYDDWYYYGGNASRYSWTSGFGGSYWWGYQPWRGSSSYMGYGWSAWDSPGFGYSVNYYLGRPHYHYPVALSGWDNHRWTSHHGPVTVINNNTYNYYYGSEKRNSPLAGSSGYNPPGSNTSGRRQGYTATGGRSSASGTDPATSGTAGTQTGTRNSTQTGAQSGTRTGTRSNSRTGTRGSTQAGTRGSTQAGTRGGTTGVRDPDGTVKTQPDSEKDKGNNGLRMGQNRRGVAEPAEPGDNGLPRTSNPNVNDRTDPGREQNSADRAPVRDPQREQVQNTVRTTSKREETVMRQGTPAGTRLAGETSAQQSGNRKTETTSGATGKSDESKKTTTSPKRRR